MFMFSSESSSDYSMFFFGPTSWHFLAFFSSRVYLSACFMASFFLRFGPAASAGLDGFDGLLLFSTQGAGSRRIVFLTRWTGEAKASRHGSGSKAWYPGEHRQPLNRLPWEGNQPKKLPSLKELGLLGWPHEVICPLMRLGLHMCLFPH